MMQKSTLIAASVVALLGLTGCSVTTSSDEPAKKSGDEQQTTTAPAPQPAPAPAPIADDGQDQVAMAPAPIPVPVVTPAPTPDEDADETPAPIPAPVVTPAPAPDLDQTPAPAPAPTPGPATGGSCNYDNVVGKYCGESASADYQIECSLFGGTWSASACNQSLYATRCVQQTDVSIDDGPTTQVTYTYYYPADTLMTCFGDSTPLR